MTEPPDINKVLAYAAIQGIDNLTKRSLNSIRKSWIEARGVYGFTYTPEEANEIKKTTKDPTYVAFKECIGSSFRHLKFIKIGLLIFQLRKKGDRERIEQIKEDIYQSRYGQVPNKLIHLASLGILPAVLDYLTHLKTHAGLSKNALHREFMKLLDLWKDVSIDVKRDTSQTDLKNMIKSLMSKKPAQIVIYGSGRAAYTAQRVIAELINRRFFSNKYLPWNKTIPFSQTDVQFICFLYSVNFGVDTPFG